MRSMLFWITTLALVAGALSAVVATATVQWLYPQGRRAAAPAPASAVVQEQAVLPAADPVLPPGPGEHLALEVLRRAGSGDLQGALALTTLPAETLEPHVGRLKPAPQRAAQLPGPAGQPEQVLVWADYHRESGKARGLYQVTLGGGKVTGLLGPMAPEGGYAPLNLPLFDEKGRKVDLAQYRGRGLVLVAPRNPEQDLALMLSQFHTAYAGKGVEVILVTDVRSPDWTAAARQGGYKGQIWRVKARLEDVPVPIKGQYLGAAGVLVDREGIAVASLAALDPSRYGLLGRPALEIAPAVLRAYGLIASQ